MLSKGGQNYYYNYNTLKEITGLTNASGTVVASYAYDAWGNILSQSGTMAETNPIRYKVYRYDNETKLYYLIARYYQPAEGVFLVGDPDGGDTDDPKTQNGYAYASSNPVMYTDPDGNYIWLAVNAGFAAYDGYKAYKSGESAGKIAKSAALGFAGGGKFKATSKILRINGNSLKSRKANHGYEIYQKVNGKNTVVKVGISGGKISKAGKSYRATNQANKWTNEYGQQFHTRVVKKNMTRAKALKWEQGRVNSVKAGGGQFKRQYHKRPKAW